MSKLLFVDTETGGLDPSSYSLLSIAFVVWADCKIEDYFQVFLDDGNLRVNEAAIAINKFDLNEHKKRAVDPKTCMSAMNVFFDRHFEKTESITLVGHNVNFDINFLKSFYGSVQLKFSDRFSHRSIDTSSILSYLYFSGIINVRAVSSEAAFDLFNIRVDQRHSALGDAIATCHLFNSLISLGKSVPWVNMHGTNK